MLMGFVHLLSRSIDVPLAPKLLGQLTGRLHVDGTLGLDTLVDLAGVVEGAEPRRAYAAAALNALKVGDNLNLPVLTIRSTCWSACALAISQARTDASQGTPRSKKLCPE